MGVLACVGGKECQLQACICLRGEEGGGGTRSIRGQYHCRHASPHSTKLVEQAAQKDVQGLLGRSHSCILWQLYLGHDPHISGAIKGFIATGAVVLAAKVPRTMVWGGIRRKPSG